MFAIDLHVHSNLSACSCMAPAEIVAAAFRTGLDAVCITDHDTMAIGRCVREGRQPNGVQVFFGMEYTTAAGDFLLFGPFETLSPGLPARDLLATVEQQGGVAIAAHPCRSWRPVQEFVFAEGLCLLTEAWNGRNTQSENCAALAQAARYGLAACAGSDAHSVAELGVCATSLFEPVQSRQELVQALRRQRFSCNAMPAALPRRACASV